MKIDFFLVGAQKAGTTAMQAVLRKHTQICMSEPKELHVFDQVDELGDPALRERLTRAFRGRTAETRVLGDATPAYCFFPHAIERLHRHNPAARIVMLLRHPAYRAFSHWRMERARGVESMSFVEAIGERARARLETDASAFRAYSYLERGYYAPQVERILAHFGAQRCLFLRTDAFWNDPQRAMDGVCDLLQVSRARVGGEARMLRPLQVDEGLVLDVNLRDALNALYRADIHRTEALIGLPLGDWLAPDYEEPMLG